MTTKLAKLDNCETRDTLIYRWLFNNKGITPDSPVCSSNASPKGSRKRKSSSSFNSRPKSTLWPWVSDWEKRTAEKYLHIFYDDDYSDPEEVLRNGDIKTELNDDQMEYIEVLKKYLKFSLQFSDLVFKDSDFQINNCYSRLEATLLGLEDDVRKAKKPKKMKGETFFYLKIRLIDFCNELRILLKKMVNDNRKTHICYEGAFQDFVCSFAEMCCLKARICSQSDHSVWINLKGATTVKSRPDCRFYKYGLDYKMSKTMFSVIEVKRDESLRSSYEDLTSHEPMEKKRPHTSSCTSSLLSSPSSSRMDFSDVSLEGNKTSIEKVLNKGVLGQHAGELLLDLHKLKEDEKSSKLTIPGMIVDGTKVYLTLLKITEEHYQKLKRNKDLTDDDRAKIYYSKPYDILTEWKRNILIKSFMTLNNADCV